MSMRMTRRSVLALGSCALNSQLLWAQTIHLMPDPSSEFALEVKKTGLMAGKKHHLVFRKYKGTFSQQPSPQVTFTVEAGSLVCEDDWVKPKDREKITRYALNDLLEASQYPTFRYQSTTVQPNGAGYAIIGNLTIKDQTRPVLVHVVRQVNGGRTIWTGDATIRLTDFHLKPPTAALGAIGTEDAMQLSFRLRARGAEGF